MASIGRLGTHDMGGSLASIASDGAIETRDPPLQHWELQTDAVLGLMVVGGHISIDEHRRSVEALEPHIQLKASYYEKWALAMAALLLEKQKITLKQLDAQLFGESDPAAAPAAANAPFANGEVVRVKEESLRSRWRRPHLRAPGYIHGACGVVEKALGEFSNPEILAFANVLSKPDSAGTENKDKPDGPPQILYRVVFKQVDLWNRCGLNYQESPNDTVSVEVYQDWLEKVDDTLVSAQSAPVPKRQKTDEGHHHDEHQHEHDHHHEPRADVEATAIEKEGKPTQYQVYAEALCRALLEAKFFTPAELRNMMEKLESLGTKNEGPRIVVKAWTDAGFRERLLKDANLAVKELGLNPSNNTAPTMLVAVENTDAIHNVIVCTLCSCYPRAILGLSPLWYRSRAYRSRVVIEPRKVLSEFGTDIPETTEIRIHDSTAECRYIVIPKRPKGSEGMSEEKLMELVTRDSMIGVAEAQTPAN